MEINHPRRLMVVGTPECDLANLVRDLTDEVPAKDESGSVAGSLHEWKITTNYYSAIIPIWIDEITDIEQWANDFSEDEAKEVVRAIAGWIYCFNKTSTSDGMLDVEKAIEAIEKVIENACGYSWEGVKLAVALSPNKTSDSVTISKDDYDDMCMDHGFEFVDASATGRNEFREKQGMERLKEALQANDWSPSADEHEEGNPSEGFEAEEEEMTAELWGLKASLRDASNDDEANEEATLNGDASQVDNLERLMSQAFAIKEAGADLPLEERKKHAARAINQLMDEI